MARGPPEELLVLQAILPAQAARERLEAPRLEAPRLEVAQEAGSQAVATVVQQVVRAVVLPAVAMQGRAVAGAEPAFVVARALRAAPAYRLPKHAARSSAVRMEQGTTPTRLIARVGYRVTRRTV